MRKRTKKFHTVYFPEELKLAIDASKWLSPTHPFNEVPNHPEGMGKTYQRFYYQMKTLGKWLGIEDCRSHRLRDTFAVRHLENGMQIGDVSKMLFHASVKMTERYYSFWSKGREDRLEKLAAESFSNAA
jgi:integrase